ncbi:MAG: Trk system potassium transporter TrkA [Prevotellaceae bacterium]|jgi:trk system potassium uptake protein TrkA|nr:Trk system potassium transporter TrkA [Prevotellaceae bacterium]
MKIIIAGAGNVGRHLAKLLAREKANITLMDEDPSRLSDLEFFDFMTFEGSPTSIYDLQEAGVTNVDLFVAVTPNESVNMTACMIANNLGAKKTLARINNYEYLLPKNSEFFAKLGVNHLIYPEVLAAQAVVDSLQKNWMRQYLSFKQGELVMLSVKVRSNAEIVNKKFISGYFNHQKYRVVAINRNTKTIIPSGADEILANDTVYFIASKENLDFVRLQAGKEDFKIKNVMIMGATRIAQKVVQTISHDFSIKILEKSHEACLALSDKLRDNTLIINADGRDVETLKEEDIMSMDAFVAVTESSEANILACMVAKGFGVKKIIAAIENVDYIALSEQIDIGSLINKKVIAAGYIHQITLDSDVLDVRTLPAADAEIVELMANNGSKITKKQVKNIHLPENVNIGGIIRNGQGMIVNGDTQIQPGDHVIVFCKANATRKLDALF